MLAACWRVGGGRVRVSRPTRVRITSYNVCYTKLLRAHRMYIHGGEAFLTILADEALVQPVAFGLTADHLLEQRQIFCPVFGVSELIPAYPVITSYSIHYTKLYDFGLTADHLLEQRQIFCPVFGVSELIPAYPQQFVPGIPQQLAQLVVELQPATTVR